MLGKAKPTFYALQLLQNCISESTQTQNLLHHQRHWLIARYGLLFFDIVVFETRIQL